MCGASFGAYLAALLIADRRIDRLLLRAPALPEGASLPPGMASFSGSVLIVVSERDEVIPPSTVAAYTAAFGGRARHEVIRGATHALTDPAWRRVFIDLIVEWCAGLERP